MNAKQLKAWESTRKKGKRMYITIHWILKYALTLAVLFTIYQKLDPRNDPNWISWFVIRLVVFSVISIIVGAYQWEKKDAQFREQRNLTEEGEI